ncbi:MAG: alpha/beta hydrolase fold domain-containing protein [Isosphaeraceae bacterium]|nr:alpha/beta hydrolase fold domain-containing protein [Isosphaeraceae bacterium]
MSRLPRIGISALGLGILIAALAPARGEDAPPPPSTGRTPPSPVSEPIYPHRTVKRVEIGSGARSYWLFEPADPKPERAPVVVFNHGWFAVNPGVYGAWIEHLVRSGRIVIFPRYQNDVATKPVEFLDNALAAIRDAFVVLETSPKHVKPDRSRFALVGHSAGGNLAAQLAAVAVDHGLPEPRAVLAMMPGEVQPVPGVSLARIPASTLLVVVAGEDDVVVGDLRPRDIFVQAASIPSARKKYVLFRTDLHGTPRLVADHLAPTGYERSFDSGDGVLRGFQTNQAEINALDRFGFWRVTDITLEAGFRGLTLDEATRKGDLFRHIGYWTDGRQVVPPVVGDDLTTIPRIYPTNGIKLFRWPMGRVAAAPAQTVRN